LLKSLVHDLDSESLNDVSMEGLEIGEGLLCLRDGIVLEVSEEIFGGAFDDGLKLSQSRIDIRMNHRHGLLQKLRRIEGAVSLRSV